MVVRVNEDAWRSVDGVQQIKFLERLTKGLERQGCHGIVIGSFTARDGYFVEDPDQSDQWVPPYIEAVAAGWQSDIGKKLIEDLAEWKTRALEYAYLLQAHGIRLDGGIQEAG